MDALQLTSPETPMIPSAQFTGNLRNLPVNMIYPNPNQPRKDFDQEYIGELSQSILKSGLLQPIAVVPKPSKDGAWMIVAGENRWRASRLAGLEEIPAIVRDIDASTVAELALIENIIRRDLNVMEEAKGYGAFIDNGYTIESLSKLLGHKDTARVRDRLALLNLDASLQDGVRKGAIQGTQALAMSRLSREGQFTLWRAIQDGRCETAGKLRRLASALLDLESQTDLFSTKPLTAAEKASLTKVDRFVDEAGKLLSMIDADDLTVVENTPKADAGICIDRLLLLAKSCYRVANALQTSVAKTEATSIQ